MKKQNTQDERVVAQRRKINSESFGLLMIVLITSVYIQQFLLNAPFAQYAAELTCFIGMAFYLTIRYLTLGINIYGDEKRAGSPPVVNSMVAGMVVTAINGVLHYSQYAPKYHTDGMGYFFAMLAITFISATVFTLAVLSSVSYLNKKRQAQIQKQLDDDEQED